MRRKVIIVGLSIVSLIIIIFACYFSVVGIALWNFFSTGSFNQNEAELSELRSVEIPLEGYDGKLVYIGTTTVDDPNVVHKLKITRGDLLKEIEFKPYTHERKLFSNHDYTNQCISLFTLKDHKYIQVQGSVFIDLENGESIKFYIYQDKTSLYNTISTKAKKEKLGCVMASSEDRLEFVPE